MALTPEQIQRMNQITGMNKPVSSAQTSKDARIAELRAIASAASGTKKPSIFGEMKDQFKSGVDMVKAGASDIGEGGTVKGLEGGLKAEAGVATAALAPLAPVFNRTVTPAIEWAGDKLGGTKFMQEAAAGLEPGNALERTLGDVTNAGVVAGTIAGAPGMTKGVAAIPKTIRGVADAVKVSPEQLARQEAESAASAASAKTAAQEALLKKGTDSWTKFVDRARNENPTRFRVAEEVLAKNPDTARFLAEQKMHANDYIENGYLNTRGAALEMARTGMKLSNEILRPALEEARHEVPITLLKEITDKVGQFLDPTEMAGVEMEAISKQITKELNITARKYEKQGGLDLVNLHDEKINNARIGGYKATTMLDTSAARAHRILGLVYKQLLEEKAPPGLDVKGVNEYFGKYFKAADYLKALDKKKAPIPTVSEIANRGAKVLGAVTGHAIGGSMLPGVGGYIMGGILEHAVENLIRSGHTNLLKNLETTNNPAFKAAMDYIVKSQSERSSRLALPPGAEQGTAETSGVKSVPAGKYPVSANPETGKFQTMYHQGEGKLNNPESGFVKNPLAGSLDLSSGSNAANALVMAPQKEMNNENLAPSIEKARSIYPEVPKGLIEAVLNQESSTGTDTRNWAGDAGHMGWIGGITKTGTYGDMLKNPDIYDVFKKIEGSKDLSTVDGAVGVVASILAQHIRRNYDGHLPNTAEAALEVYDKFYKSHKGAELTPQQKQNFKKVFNQYSK